MVGTKCSLAFKIGYLLATNNPEAETKMCWLGLVVLGHIQGSNDHQMSFVIRVILEILTAP